MTGGRDRVVISRSAIAAERAHSARTAAFACAAPRRKGKGGGERAGLALVLTPNRAASSAESEEL